MLATLDDIRKAGLRVLGAMLWANVAVEVIAAGTLRAADAWYAVGFGLLVNLLPMGMILAGRVDRTARMTLGLAAVIHPAIILFLFREHPWQMDLHLYFLAALAAVAVMCDWRPLVAGAGFVALHHLVLGHAAHHWVFSTPSGTTRVVLHAVIVVAQVLVLGWLTGKLASFAQASQDARARSDEMKARAEASADEARRAVAELQAAQAVAVAERTAREAAERREVEARRAAMLDLAERFEHSVAAIVESVSAAAGQLGGSASLLADISRETSRQAGVTAASAGTAHMSVQTMAAATEELAASIAEIATRVEHQAQLTEVARSTSGDSDRKVSQLADEADGIGEVIGLIDQIAEQTNLLALNATIEAARAGDAGRGFAVVAQEVKHLAGQTAGATAEITGMVTAVRGRIHAAVEAIRQVDAKIIGVSEIAGAIAAAAGQQRVAAGEIGRHAEVAAGGTRVLEQGIAQLSDAAQRAGTLSGEVQGAAGELAVQASRLREAADSFIGHLRAA